MGFLRKLFAQPAPTERVLVVELKMLGTSEPIEDRTTAIPEDGALLYSGGGVDVVGESHYRDALVRQTGGERRDGVNMYLTAALVPEPENPHDPNAVSIRIGGEVVGYLSRADARQYSTVLEQLRAAGFVAYCKARVRAGWNRGGGDRGDFSVHLYIGSPDRQARLLEERLAPARADRPYASTVCPYCQGVLKRLPKAKSKCPSCGKPIYVRSGPDGYLYLLQEQDLPVLDEAWKEYGESLLAGHR